MTRFSDFSALRECGGCRHTPGPHTPRLTLESVSRGAWHCVAQHFQNSAQRSAQIPRRPILRPVGDHFLIYLGLGVYGHGVCACTLFTSAADPQNLTRGQPAIPGHLRPDHNFTSQAPPDHNDNPHKSQAQPSILKRRSVVIQTVGGTFYGQTNWLNRY